jgi:PAS domain S-box-containing protein
MAENKLRILVVEDDDVDRMIIKRALKDSKINHELNFAVDHESGKEATNGKEYDCIFLDYNLPGGSGLELLKTIREAGNSSPIIMVTSQGDEKIAVDAMKLGADDYIPKNFLSGEGIGQIVRYMVNKKKQELRQNELENQLKNTQKQLQTVVENAPIILFSLDNAATFKLFEGKGIEASGINKKKILGTSLYDNEALPISLEDYKRAMNGEEFKKIVHWKQAYFEISYSPIRVDNKAISGVLGIATDITQHIQAEEELKHAKHLAEETVRVKQQFLANISHEIRTPMNGIIGLTRILLDSPLNPEQVKYLQSINACNTNLLTIINDLLDVSKIEAGKMNLEKISFDIHELVNQTMELYQAKADEKALQLCLEKDGALPHFVEGDPTRLSQILNNLVSNAIKFTEKGEVRLSLRQSANDGKNVTIVFDVKDSGIGIPEKSLSMIFESFTQAYSDTTRRYGGTGLGLTIVKNLVELQDGEIRVKSKPGAGTTFTFTLSFPISSVREVSTASVAAENSDISHLRILIAEDNKINQMVIEKTFADWRVKTDLAENGILAVEMLKKKEYDLVLMDIQMPEMDGYTAVEIIRKKLSTHKRSVPIMAMTAHASMTEKQKCLDAGMQDYISKPFDPAELKSKIISICGARTAAGQRPSVVPEPSAGQPEKNQKTTQEPMSLPENSFAPVKINLDYLKQLSAGNQKFYNEMIETFLNMTPQALDQMNQCFQKKEWEMLRSIAHRIKPSYGYVGLKDVQNTLTQIEKWNDKGDTDTVGELLQTVKNSTDSAFGQLRQALNGNM